jgi:hypothetical protein
MLGMMTLLIVTSQSKEALYSPLQPKYFFSQSAAGSALDHVAGTELSLSRKHFSRKMRFFQIYYLTIYTMCLRIV